MDQGGSPLPLDVSCKPVADNHKHHLADYGRVRNALVYCAKKGRGQPSVDEIAAHIGLSPAQVHQMFARWAGLTPTAFLQALTPVRAKLRLGDGASLLDAGLSTPDQLCGFFIGEVALSPGPYKTRGAGFDIRWGWQASPFGAALIMLSPHGLAGLAFADPGDETAAFEDMAQRWPKAAFFEDATATGAAAARIFDPVRWRSDIPLRVHLIGSDFEIRVWEALLRIPMGRALSYGDIAAALGKPSAARAVGTAVGRNPISFLVPCHRVLGRGGALCGYHWGLTRKQAMIGWEAGQIA